MIFGDDDGNDDIGRFTNNPFQIRIESKDEVAITKWQLQSLHEKIDQLLLASKDSSSEAYSKAVVESLFERTTKEHKSNVAKMNKAVADFVEVCKTMTEKNLGPVFKVEKDNWQDLRKGLQKDHETFQTSIISQITKLQDDLAMESKDMDALAVKM
ncbi:unnamed protein product [Lactuca saligna]|uniref:Uncharacterized protein n=1 Tax=Lactuca saligna TaxID=75948 RepID=A0AA35ZFG0_LACSI|nr:unnamed protein product [Lactuca saligna]